MNSTTDRTPAMGGARGGARRKNAGGAWAEREREDHAAEIDQWNALAVEGRSAGGGPDDARVGCDSIEAGNWVRDSRGGAVSTFYSGGECGAGAGAGKMAEGEDCSASEGDAATRRAGARPICRAAAEGAFGRAAAEGGSCARTGGGPADSADG